MPKQTNDDFTDERAGQSDAETERLRGIAGEEEFEESDELDEEDLDDDDESTF